MLDREVIEAIHRYSESRKEQIFDALSQLAPSEEQIEAFNQEVDTEVRVSFQNIMAREDFPSLCSLLQLLCKCIGKTPIKKSVVINMLDNVLECVGVTDLKQVLTVIRDQIGNFGLLDFSDSNKLLRIINTLLKRISKTEDFHIRGELQMSLTKILSLCHDSGFHSRSSAAKTEDINEDKTSLFQNFEQDTFTAQFFEDFWELQKYFMMPVSQLTAVDGSPKEHNPKLLSSRLNRIQGILAQTIKYFRQNPAETANNIENFPLKFLKLPNLLALQFGDAYFRAVIMFQVRAFCLALKSTTGKTQIVLDAGQKETVGRIEKSSEQELVTIERSLNVEGLNAFIDGFFQNQASWIELKDNWKERKKTLFKEPSYEIRQLKRSLFDPTADPIPAPPAQPSVTAPINLKEKLSKYSRETLKKIGIQDSKMSSFLANLEPPNLNREPSLPSFSYYFSQADSCIDSFDFENERQVQFDSRTEYNFFEWKALRSLYRERIKDLAFKGEKNSKYKDYKLLNLIGKKQDELYDQPRKRVKPNQNENQMAQS